MYKGQDQHQGEATIESYTLRYEEGLPASATLACRIGDGRRVWATSEEPGFLESLTRAEPCGRSVRVSGNTLVSDA